MTEIGKKIIELLEINNMTQRELSQKVGVQEATISRYIHGERKPTSEILVKLAECLNTTVNYLVGKDENINGLSPNYVKFAKYLQDNHVSIDRAKKIIEFLLNEGK